MVLVYLFVDLRSLNDSSNKMAIHIDRNNREDQADQNVQFALNEQFPYHSQ